jgi:hypothetical protein
MKIRRAARPAGVPVPARTNHSFVFVILKILAVASASAYVLKVNPDRRTTLLTGSDSHSGDTIASEPVPLFGHSRRSPLIVLASFDDNYLTHVGNARKGAPAGTDLVRLNLTLLHQLRRPIAFSEILSLDAHEN